MDFREPFGFDQQGGDDLQDVVRWVAPWRNWERAARAFVPEGGPPRQRRVTAARDSGVSEFLSKPFTVTGLLKRIEALIHSPRPFVKSETYFGPDRRRRDDPNYTGPDRRKPR